MLCPPWDQSQCREAELDHAALTLPSLAAACPGQPTGRAAVPCLQAEQAAVGRSRGQAPWRLLAPPAPSLGDLVPSRTCKPRVGTAKSFQSHWQQRADLCGAKRGGSASQLSSGLLPALPGEDLGAELNRALLLTVWGWWVLDGAASRGGEREGRKRMGQEQVQRELVVSPVPCPEQPPQQLSPPPTQMPLAASSKAATSSPSPRGTWRAKTCSTSP